jgi:hypothetical protein
MDNKVLVEVIVPEIDEKFNLYLPINKKIGNIIVLINQAISEMDPSHVNFDNSLYNRDTNVKYQIDTLLYHTDIRNGTTLILI